MTTRKMIIVGAAAFLFRMIFLFWGWTDCYLLEQDSMSKAYFEAGYAICAGYGYVCEIPSEEPSNDLQKLKERAEQGLRVTPQTAPRIDPSKFMPEMLHPPGMSVLVAAVHRLTGSRVDIYIEIIGMILDTAAACILYWMVATFFNGRVGFASGLIYAFYPPLAYAGTLFKTPGDIVVFYHKRHGLRSVIRARSGMERRVLVGGNRVALWESVVTSGPIIFLFPWLLDLLFGCIPAGFGDRCSPWQ